MTREEATNTLKSLKDYYNDKDECGYVEFDDEDNEAIDIAVEALKKEPVLDKIKSEIIEMRSKQNCSCADCLDIIDKYRAESEV